LKVLKKAHGMKLTMEPYLIPTFMFVGNIWYGGERELPAECWK